MINRDSATENRISGNGKKSQIPGWTYFDNISAEITVKHDGSMYEVTKYVVTLWNVCIIQVAQFYRFMPRSPKYWKKCEISFFDGIKNIFETKDTLHSFNLLL